MNRTMLTLRLMGVAVSLIGLVAVLGAGAKWM